MSNPEPFSGNSIKHLQIKLNQTHQIKSNTAAAEPPGRLEQVLSTNQEKGGSNTSEKGGRTIPEKGGSTTLEKGVVAPTRRKGVAPT